MFVPVADSLAETSSYSLYAISASYEINYETSSSYAETASISLSSSYAETASYVRNAISSSYSLTSSYVDNAISSSYVSGSEIYVTSGSINYVNVLNTFIAQGTVLLYTASLPETDPAFNGQLWRSGSFLMISTGSGI